MSESIDSSPDPTAAAATSASDLPLEAETASVAAQADADAATTTADLDADLSSQSAAQDLAPVPDPPSSTPVPSELEATSAAPARTGPKGKTRSPIGGWLLLIPTLGIYYLFWYFNINRELRDYDPAVKVTPVWAVVSLFIPIVGLISVYNTGNRIRQAQSTAGAPAEASGLLGLIASIFFVLDIPYYNSQLNNVWQHA